MDIIRDLGQVTYDGGLHMKMGVPCYSMFFAFIYL